MAVLNLNVPMVIFTEDKFSRTIRSMRSGKANITRVVTMDFQDVGFYRYRGRMEEVKRSEKYQAEFPLKSHPESFSTDDVILTHSKLTFLLDAIQMDVFKSSFYFWLDFGYGHGTKEEKTFPDGCRWEPRNIMTSSVGDKITIVQLNKRNVLSELSSVFDLYLNKTRSGYVDVISAGFFGGSRTAVHQLYRCYMDVFEKEFLAQDRLDDEQVVIAGCWFRQPGLFNLVNGSWFDAFKLFH